MDYIIQTQFVTIVLQCSIIDSIMNAINEINKKSQVNEIFLFCGTTIMLGWNMSYLHLSNELISSKKIVQGSEKNCCSF